MASDLSALHALTKKLSGVTCNTESDPRCYTSKPDNKTNTNTCETRNTETPVTRDFIDRGKYLGENLSAGVSQDFDIVEFFDERAAILEFDSGLPRKEAERWARIETDQEAARRGLSTRLLPEG